MNSISEYDNGLDDLDYNWDNKSDRSDESVDYDVPPIKKPRAESKVIIKKNTTTASVTDSKVVVKKKIVAAAVADSKMVVKKKVAAAAAVADSKVVVKKKVAATAAVQSTEYTSDKPAAPSKAPKKPSSSNGHELIRSTSASQAAITDRLPVMSDNNPLQMNKTENTGEDSFSLDQFSLSDSTVEHLNARGIASLFPIQAQTFWPIRRGKDLIGRARTGQGNDLLITSVISKCRSRSRLMNHFSLHGNFKLLLPSAVF